jgi:hypothetical protein
MDVRCESYNQMLAWMCAVREWLSDGKMFKCS